ncbi:MAG: response regulator transcription factor [bacterium]|nr:response regulator transcription factor [bacterium]
MVHTVLIVEDEARTRQRLERAVGRVPDLALIAAVGSVREARAVLPEQVDLMLVDLGLPDGDGVDLIREARRLAPGTRTMVITVFADEQHVMRAIRAGAQGYLLKDGSAQYLANAMLELLAGGSPISPAIARHLLQSVQQAAPRLPDGPVPQLSARELEILSLIAKGFRVPEVAELLKIADRTVTTHVQHIYRKLEVSSRSEAIYEAVNLGLIDLKG